jgi:hypothetical protein
MKKRINLFSLVKIVIGFLLLLTIPWLSNFYINYIEVSSHLATNKANESISEKLNHANTYYSWGRYKNNTLPEFEKCSTLCKEIIKEIELKDKINPQDSISLFQATKLVEQCQTQIEVCKLNANSAYPYYNEIMSVDEAYKEEDCDFEEFQLKGIQQATAKLISLNSPDKNVLIKDRTIFGLVIGNENNPIQEELITQTLSSSAKIYTISDHEIQKILGIPVVNKNSIIKDSLSIKKIAKAFNTDEIAFISVFTNDNINDIAYYGMRFDLWNAKTNKKSHSLYSEYFLQDKIYNQIPYFKLPLTLIFLIIAIALSLFISGLIVLFPSLKGFNPMIAPIAFFVGILCHFAFIDFAIPSIISTSPNDYFAGDNIMIWSYILALSFSLIPPFITYIVIGKLDKHIYSFNSNINQYENIFMWFFGSMLTLPAVFTYYHILRFGTNADFQIYLGPTLMVLLISILIARHISNTFNFPSVISPVYKISTYILIGVHFYILTDFATLLFQMKSAVEINQLIIQQYLGFIVFIEIAYLLINWISNYFKSINHSTEINNYPKPVFHKLSSTNIETAKISMDNIEITSENTPAAFGFGCSETIVRGLHLKAIRGIVGANIDAIFCNDSSIHRVYLDFSGPSIENVHYPRFAKCFESEFAHNFFNDSTEVSRKAGNLLGNIINNFAKIGGFLIDETDPKPRKAEELAEAIVNYLHKYPSLHFCFDHIQEIQRDELELLILICNQLEKKKKQFRFTIFEYTPFAQLDELIKSLKLNDSITEIPTFKIQYYDIADSALENKDIPIPLKLKLERLINDEEKDISPEHINDKIYQYFIDADFFDETTPWNLQKFSFNALIRLPETNYHSDLFEKIANNKELLNILVACAHAADSDGYFKLKIVEHFTQLNRLALLQAMNDAEDFKIISDLKDKAHYDVYLFNDKSLLASLKDTENANIETISQITRFYYFKYIEYFLNNDLTIKSADRYFEKIATGHIQPEEIITLLNRVYPVYQENPAVLVYLLFRGANYMTQSISSNYGEAKKYLEQCDEILQSGFDKSESLNDEQYADLLLTKYEVYNELRVAEHTLKNLYDELLALKTSNITLFNAIEPSIIFSRIKQCFIYFTNSSITEGNELIAEYANKFKDVAHQTRLKFYALKLIPGNSYSNLDAEVFNSTLKTYLEIISALENINDDQLKKEVYNDFAGSFVTDKLLSKRANSENKFLEILEKNGFVSADKFLNYVEAIFVKRLAIESIVINSINELARLSYSIRNNKHYDQRGLCYTLNYLTRYFVTNGRLENAINIGKTAYYLNKKVKDLIGACISAGTIAECYTHLQDYKNAYLYHEKSFGFGYLSNHASVNSQIIKMKSAIKQMNDAGIHLIEAVDYYNDLLGKKHVLKHFDFKNDLLKYADTLLISSNDIRPITNINGSKFLDSFVVDPNALWVIVHSINDLAKNQTLKENGENISVELPNLKNDASGNVHFDYCIIQSQLKKDHFTGFDFEKIELELNFHIATNKTMPWFGTGIGLNNVIPIINKENCYLTDRQNHKVWEMESEEKHYTHKMQLIISHFKALDLIQVNTIFPGDWAPALPLPNMPESEQIQSKTYWDKHAFVKYI